MYKSIVLYGAGLITGMGMMIQYLSPNRDEKRFKKTLESQSEYFNEKISSLQLQVSENSRKVSHLLATKKGVFLTNKQMEDTVNENNYDNDYLDHVVSRSEDKLPDCKSEE